MFYEEEIIKLALIELQSKFIYTTDLRKEIDLGSRLFKFKP